jgi:hypothetical protein
VNYKSCDPARDIKGIFKISSNYIKKLYFNNYKSIKSISKSKTIIKTISKVYN